MIERECILTVHALCIIIPLKYMQLHNIQTIFGCFCMRAHAHLHACMYYACMYVLCIPVMPCYIDEFSSIVAISVNFSQVQYSFNEGMDDMGSGNAPIQLMFSNPSSFDIIVFVISNDNTAMGVNSSECLEMGGSEDYLFGVYTVTFPANSTVQIVDIQICDDNVLEKDEIFGLTIFSNSHPDNVTNGSPDHVTVTIVDNDGECFILVWY